MKAAAQLTRAQLVLRQLERGLKIDEERVLPDLIERIQNIEQRVAVLEHEFRQHVESIPHEPPAGE